MSSVFGSNQVEVPLRWLPELTSIASCNIMGRARPLAQCRSLAVHDEEHIGLVNPVTSKESSQIKMGMAFYTNLST